jgi:hypothetical protein
MVVAVMVLAMMVVTFSSPNLAVIEGPNRGRKAGQMVGIMVKRLGALAAEAVAGLC